jgi:PPOX class probable F420-dependent enzyme
VTAVRTKLNVEDLGNLLQQPLVAVVATLRKDGSVLLSPVCHEWRDGGFNLWIIEDVKTRHLRRDPRATIVVAESEEPYRGVEVRGVAQLIDHDVFDIAARIMARYLGKEEGAAYVKSLLASTSSRAWSPAASERGTSPTSRRRRPARARAIASWKGE